MFLLLMGFVFQLVYLSSKVEQKVTLFCIISILVLLTHMLFSINIVLYFEHIQFHIEHMGQKDQDGYYAEKCHIFFNFGA